MLRLGWPLVALAALSLTACLDDPAVRERLGVDLNGSPLPGSSPSAGPSPTAVPSASTPATSPIPSETIPSPSPTATPAAPGVTGDYRRTFDPLDLAIAGPGYFVVSTTPNPQEMQDVYFTRNGEFDLVFTPSGSPAPSSLPSATDGVWRLEAASGLIVVGWSYDGPDGTPVPPEGRSDYFAGAFTLGGSGSSTYRAGALSFASTVNETIAPGFNFKGQLLNQNRPPTQADGTQRQLYVAVAQFEHPEALVAATGFPGYRYRPECGRVSAGIAGVVSAPAGVQRPVGDANLIRTETLER